MATAQELADLRQRIANLLMAGPVQRIGFRIGGHDITPGGFTVIGMSLATADVALPGARRRAMSVRISEHLPPHAAAAYHANDNSIHVPTAGYGGTHRQRLTLVHEAVHAIFDFQRIRLNAIQEEAAAYIADAMYSSLLGFPSGSAIRLERTARAIADTLLPRSPGTGGARPEVTQAQLTELTGHIHAHPVYNPMARSYGYPHNGGTL